MTSLIAWIGADSRGPASAYFASDSRISWPRAGAWDHGRKLFACHRYPHILGYCGDVFFPTQTLSQVIEMIDSDLLCGPTDGVDACLERIISTTAHAFETYPREARSGFEVIHCMRQGDGMAARFHLSKITFTPGLRPAVSAIEVPQESRVVAILGSGSNSISAQLAKWRASDVGGTSRSVFAAFCDSLRRRDDPFSGGPPQLVGLWRRAQPKTFGIIWQQRRYFYGTDVESTSVTEVQWYNELFEICDPVTLARRPDAQPQPRPGGLDSG